MSGGLTGVAAVAALNYLTGRSLDMGTTIQTMQLALLTAPPPSDPGVSDLSEVAATGYARQDIGWSAATTPTSGQPSNIANSANLLYGPFTAVGGLGFPATHCALLGRVVAPDTSNLMTPNQAEIETDATAWSPLLNASVAPSTAHFHSGAQALAVTSTAAGSTQVKTAVGLAVSPFTTYTASGWAFTTATGNQCKVELAFYDSSNTLIQRTGGSNSTLTANTWTQLSFSAMAPANAVTAAPIMNSSPTASATVTYWDTLSFAAAMQQKVLMTWQFDTAGSAAQNESLQVSAGALDMALG
jgi:hypothetical protein